MIEFGTSFEREYGEISRFRIIAQQIFDNLKLNSYVKINSDPYVGYCQVEMNLTSNRNVYFRTNLELNEFEFMFFLAHEFKHIKQVEMGQLSPAALKVDQYLLTVWKDVLYFKIAHGNEHYFMPYEEDANAYAFEFLEKYYSCPIHKLMETMSGGESFKVVIEAIYAHCFLGEREKKNFQLENRIAKRSMFPDGMDRDISETFLSFGHNVSWEN